MSPKRGRSQGQKSLSTWWIPCFTLRATASPATACCGLSKNRFGATHELGVFEMVDRGLEQISNPSALFLSNRDEQVPGIATIVACEGTRPLLVELQALVSPTSYSSPPPLNHGY